MFHRYRALGQLIRWLAFASMITSKAVWADYEDHDRVRQLMQVGGILPLATVIEIYRQRYPSGRILEAELEAEHGRYLYALEVLLDNGWVLELEYDAHTGELLEIEREG
jgi:uncharacterized membrane protein YkoI